MTFEEQQDWIEAYLDGRLSPEGQAEVEARASADAAFAEELMLQRMLHQQLGDPDVLTLRSRLQDASRSYRVWSRRRRLLRMTSLAGLAFVLGIGAYWWMSRDMLPGPDAAELASMADPQEMEEMADSLIADDPELAVQEIRPDTVLPSREALSPQKQHRVIFTVSPSAHPRFHWDTLNMELIWHKQQMVQLLRFDMRLETREDPEGAILLLFEATSGSKQPSLRVPLQVTEEESLYVTRGYGSRLVYLLRAEAAWTLPAGVYRSRLYLPEEQLILDLGTLRYLE